MTDNKKKCLYKPPVPARPKNLVVLNCKHLPKPPETFSSENVTNIIKELNLDVKSEKNEREKKRKEQSRNTENSDSEEETYCYLEPVSFSSQKATEEENLKIRDFLKTVIHKNGSTSLGRRLSHEMADLGFNFKRQLRKAVEKRYLEVISEESEVEDQISQAPHSQRQRPLPSLPLPPKETKSLVAVMPWYKNVDRKKGEEILRDGVDGCFLVRPSSNAETYLTLTLWHNSRVYNIPIRKRKDGKFALGTPKAQEQCFSSVENLIKNYQSEKLVLYSNGVQTGKTLLTTYPP